MPQCILTDFKVSGPKSWNVQIAMSVKLRLPCFSKDIQAWLLHAFDICRLVFPPSPSTNWCRCSTQNRWSSFRRLAGSLPLLLPLSPYLSLPDLPLTMLSVLMEAVFLTPLCFFFFSLIIFNLIYDYSCSRFIDIRYGSWFFVNSIYNYSCS